MASDRAWPGGVSGVRPGRGFTSLLDFLIASTFLLSVPEIRIEGQILHSVPEIGKQVVFCTLFLKFQNRGSLFNFYPYRNLYFKKSPRLKSQSPKSKSQDQRDLG